MRSADEFDAQMRRLVIGLADQDIKDGQGFGYDGGVLHAEEVADLALPSILCLAQDLSQRLGVGDLGYRFELATANPVFPLHALHERQGVGFSAAAPFVTEVFEHEVRECRHDLARLFEMAAQRVQPDYTLAANTTYSTPSASNAAPAEPSSTSTPTLGR